MGTDKKLKLKGLTRNENHVFLMQYEWKYVVGIQVNHLYHVVTITPNHEYALKLSKHTS